MVNHVFTAGITLIFLSGAVAPVWAQQTSPSLAAPPASAQQALPQAVQKSDPAWQNKKGSVWGKTAQENDKPTPSKLLMSGVDAFKKGQFRLARHIFREVAETEQSVQAYHLLGMMASEGLDEPIDDQKAAGYWVQAVKKDFAPSLYQLGKAYRYGYGLEIVPENAMELFERAAERHPGASYELGLMLDEGIVGDVDLEGALTYIRSAADRNFPDALFWLGEAYELGVLETPDQGKSANKIAADYYEKAARSGSVEAQKRLGDFYARGREGVPKNPGRAYTLIRLAADTGDAEAQAELGMLHLFGIGTVKTPAMAMALFKASSLQDQARGRFLYGNSLRQQQKIQEALVEYRAAAKQDLPEALFNLAVISFKGAAGVQPDIQQAQQLAFRAFKNGSIEAGHLLGVMAIQQGRDPVTALTWFQKAARLGHAPSVKAVKDISKKLSKQQVAKSRQLEVAAILPPIVPRARQQSLALPSRKRALPKPSQTDLLPKLTVLPSARPKPQPPTASGLSRKTIQPRQTRTPFLGGNSTSGSEVSDRATLPLPELSTLRQTPEVQDLIGSDSPNLEFPSSVEDEKIPSDSSEITVAPAVKSPLKGSLATGNRPLLSPKPETDLSSPVFPSEGATEETVAEPTVTPEASTPTLIAPGSSKLGTSKLTKGSSLVRPQTSIAPKKPAASQEALPPLSAPKSTPKKSTLTRPTLSRGSSLVRPQQLDSKAKTSDPQIPDPTQDVETDEGQKSRLTRSPTLVRPPNLTPEN